MQGPRKRQKRHADPLDGKRALGTAGGVDVQLLSSSEGYGEMTEGSIERLLLYLKTLETVVLAPRMQSVLPRRNARDASRPSIGTTDRSLNLTPDSTFIDIGSGYGKVVFHAKLSAKVLRSVGIEYVASRAKMAIDAKCMLIDGKHAFMTEEARTLLRDGCHLEHKDATTCGEFNFSHIYLYDKVFSVATLQLLAVQLNKSTYKVLVSYNRLEVWRRHGLKNVTEVGAMTMRTTGGQSFKAYVYVKSHTTERVALE